MKNLANNFYNKIILYNFRYLPFISKMNEDTLLKHRKKRFLVKFNEKHLPKTYQL